MEAGNWIALAGVAAAIISNLVTLYLGRRRVTFDREVADRRFDHERQMADRRIAGEILDEAVLELRRLDEFLGKVTFLLGRRPERFFLRGGGRETYNSLAAAGKDLDRRADRLRFRFEGNVLVDHFETAMDASSGVYAALTLIESEDYAEDLTAEVRQEIRTFCQGQASKVAELKTQFEAAFQEFRIAAFQVVGIAP